MSFLINQIKEQAILEMEVNLDKFIEENNISESSIIHTMVFDKEVFEQEIEVREYLKDKYFFSPSISEDDSSFIAVLVAPNQVDKDTGIKVDLRRGVTAHAADLMAIPTFDEIRFNDKGEINLSSKFGEINLNDGMPYIIEVARVAEGEHPSYGNLKITEEHLESFKNNFKSNVAGVDLAVNEDHRKNEAFGWFKDVFLSFDKQTLLAQITWNKKGTQALSEKEYRYFSPEFRFNYVHPHTGTEHGPTLLGGALTNYPFLKMEAITELSIKNLTKEKTMEKETIELSVHNTQLLELNGKFIEASGKVSELESKNVELNAKVEKLEKEISKSNKAVVHQKLFADEKISAAQLVALNEGKTMLEVLSLNENMNTTENGTTDVNTTVVNLSEAEKGMAKKLNLTAEEYVQYNK